MCRCWVQPVTNPPLMKQILSKHNYKILKRTLFIRTKHNMRILGETVFTKQQKRKKEEKKEEEKLNTGRTEEDKRHKHTGGLPLVDSHRLR